MNASKWDLDVVSELCARIKTLEQAVADLNERFSLEPLEARVNALEAAQKPRVFTAEEVAPIVAGRLATDEELLEIWDSPFTSSVEAFREIYNLGLKHGAAQATCPHIKSSDEGTSYCALAEQAASCKPTADNRQISSSIPTGLVERVRRVIADDTPCSYGNARAAIREVADWLEQQQHILAASWTNGCSYFAELLQYEAGR